MNESIVARDGLCKRKREYLRGFGGGGILRGQVTKKQILAATSSDENNYIYPLAFGVVGEGGHFYLMLVFNFTEDGF